MKTTPTRILSVPILGALLGAALAASTPAEEAEVIFSEKAEALGLDFVHYNGMTGELYMAEVMGGSVAVFDWDGDGDLDVYLGQGNLFFDEKPEQSILPSAYPHPVTDRLFRNELISPDGKGELRFTDVTEEVGLAVHGNNMGVSAGDIDNDGRVDLYLTNFGSNHLLMNREDGTFEDVISSAGADDDGWSVAGAFFDYDHDGWLDLAVGNYVEFREATVKECTGAMGVLDYCGPLSYAALGNRLFHNRGDGSFEDVTVKALADIEPGSTLGVVTADFNRDGWMDLYVANDLMANELWLNQGDGTFLNDAMFAGAAVDLQGFAQASMGVVAGDLNGDGAEDLFMSHLQMEMNTLYLNDGTGMFRDASRESGLGLPSWSYTGFGTALGDFDNDGWLDLYVGNGAVKRIEEQLRTDDVLPLKELNSLFMGTGPGKFREASAAERVDAVHKEVSRGVAVGDLDNDGALDLVVANNGGRARLLLNRREVDDDSWVGYSALIPVGEGARRDALGAEVSLVWDGDDGERRMFRRVRTDGSYASAVDPRVHFGLGDRGAPDRVEVRWPDGSHEVFEPGPLGRYSTLVAGTGRSVEEKSDGTPTGG